MIDFNTIGGDENSHRLARFITDNPRFRSHCLRRINAYNKLMKPVALSNMNYDDKCSVMHILYQRALDDMDRWQVSNTNFFIDIEKPQDLQMELPREVKLYVYFMITYFKIRLEAYRIEADLYDQVKEFYGLIGMKM